MKSVTFFLILLFMTLQTFADKPDCTKLNTKDVYDFIIKNHRYEDINQQMSWLQDCDQKNPRLLDDQKAKDYVQIGYQAEAKHLIEKAQSVSFYRNPEKEIKDYLQFIENHKLVDVEKKYKKTVDQVIEKTKNINSSTSKNCSPISLKDQLPPVRDQDSIGWCYAFASADLIGFKTGFPVSAIDIAVNFSSEQISHRSRSLHHGELHEDIQGGYAIGALKKIISVGVCKESDSPSEYFSENKNIVDFIKSIENPFGSLYSQGSFLYAIKNEPLCLPENSPSLKEISKVLNHSQPSNILYNLNNERCKNKRTDLKKDSFRFKEIDGEKKEIIRSIDDQLNEKMLLIVDYDASFLRNRRIPEAHSSLVVGRRFNKDNLKCEYLIRNSWGADCKHYSSPYSNPEYCEQGNIWVPQEVMHQHIYSTVSYVE